MRQSEGSWLVSGDILLVALALVLLPMAQQQQQLLMMHYQKAVDAHRAHDLPAALAAYQEVLAINPGIPAVHNNVAAILLSQGKKLDAEAAWRRAIKLKPEYAEAHYNLAIILSERGDEHLPEAQKHCELAIAHRDGYAAAHHLLGNIFASLQRPDDAREHYQRAEALAGGGSTSSGGGGTPAAAAPAAAPFRWDGVEVGHTRKLKLPDGTTWVMETLALQPLVLRVDNFLTDDECDRIVALARPRLKGSLVMGDASKAERTSSSVFLGAAEDTLLSELQRRLAALTQLPLPQVQRSEDLQVVHYSTNATFGMHHDSSKFHARLLTAFYYLNDVPSGGETAFPAADGAMGPEEAMKLMEPAASGAGLVVKPRRGSALLFYNHDEAGAVDPSAVHAGCRVLEGEKWGANHWVLVNAAPSAPPAANGATTAAGRGAEGERPEPEADAEAEADGDAPAGKNAAKNKKKREKAKHRKAAGKAAASTEEQAEPDVEQPPQSPVVRPRDEL